MEGSAFSGLSTDGVAAEEEEGASTGLQGKGGGGGSGSAETGDVLRGARGLPGFGLLLTLSPILLGGEWSRAGGES